VAQDFPFTLSVGTSATTPLVYIKITQSEQTIVLIGGAHG
jgi:hypothetical protein